MDEHINILIKIQELLLPEDTDIKNYLTKSINSISNISELDEIYSELFCYSYIRNNPNILQLCKNIHFKPNDKLIKKIFHFSTWLPENEYFSLIINIIDDSNLPKNLKYVMFNYVLLSNDSTMDYYIEKNINLMTNEMIEYIIINNSKVYERLVMIGIIQPTIDHLLYACRLCKFEIVKVIILHKVIPTLECLDNLLLSPLPEQEILDMLIEVGLPLTKNNIINIIYRKLNIKNKNYIDLIDDDVFRGCIKTDCYPEILSYFSPNMDSIHYFLRHACKKYTNCIFDAFVDSVPKYVLDSIKKCDLECLQIVLDNDIYKLDKYAPLKFVLSREIIDADYETIKKLVDKYYPDDKETLELLLNHKN